MLAHIATVELASDQNQIQFTDIPQTGHCLLLTASARLTQEVRVDEIGWITGFSSRMLNYEDSSSTARITSSGAGIISRFIWHLNSADALGMNTTAELWLPDYAENKATSGYAIGGYLNQGNNWSQATETMLWQNSAEPVTSLTIDSTYNFRTGGVFSLFVLAE